MFLKKIHKGIGEANKYDPPNLEGRSTLCRRILAQPYGGHTDNAADFI